MNSEAVAAELRELAELLRSLGVNGLHWSSDTYHQERFTMLLKAAARLQSLTDARPLPEIERIFFANLEIMTPLSAASAAIFDAGGRLLMMQRSDDHSWSLPAGSCDVGEAPATTAARETWEETGYLVEVTQLLGIFDSRICGTRSSRHIYQFLFAGRVTGGVATASGESMDVRWFAPAELPWQEIFPGHAPRVRHALAWWSDPTTPAYFDREELTPGVRH
jgi:8-oxo-dGTP pyrophosphatase MutT (NUDIX family)